MKTTGDDEFIYFALTGLTPDSQVKPLDQQRP